MTLCHVCALVSLVILGYIRQKHDPKTQIVNPTYTVHIDLNDYHLGVYMC